MSTKATGHRHPPTERIDTMTIRTAKTTGWTCREPGHWTNDAGDHFASTRKVREGALHGNGTMWRTTYNGAWLTNADTLAHAKRAVALAADLPKCIATITAHAAEMQAALDAGVSEVGKLGQHPRPLLANDRAALASDDPTIIRTHAVHL